MIQSSVVSWRLGLTARRYVLVGVTRRQHRAESWYPAAAGPQNCHGARRVWRVFLPSWYKFYWVLARSRYKFDRSRELIPCYKAGWEHWRSVAVQIWSKPENCQGIQDLNCGQMRVSGCKNHYEFVLSAGAKAKSMTNNLPILSVLAVRALVPLGPVLYLSYFQIISVHVVRIICNIY